MRALQKYMHEFQAGRDHAMCNIQNRSIPAVQLTQLRKLSNKNVQGTSVLKSSQSCHMLHDQCKVAARQWRCLAEFVSFSGSCSRCLVLSPVTMPNPPEVTKTCMWLLCEGDVGCTRCCAMSAALVPRSCNPGCGRCVHQRSERANASSPCLNINHKTLETNKNVVVEACKRWQPFPFGL
jgi:hypothetical protein